MKRKLFCALAPALCALTSFAQTYSLSRDFALANPNGAWSYGWQTFLGSTAPPPILLAYVGTNISGNGVPIQVRGLSGNPYLVNAGPDILHNATSSTATNETQGTQGTYPPGTTWVFPGVGVQPQTLCVIRFTVPNGADGTYDLATTVRPVWDGPIQNFTGFHVLRNNVELFGRTVPGGASTGYSNQILVAVGDTIDFVIGPGDWYSGLKIEATLNLTSSNAVPPKIVTQPKSQAVTENARVTFNVGVSGSSPLSYQWLLNGTAIDGATAASLTLNGVQLSEAGDYAVSVSNAYGTTTSETAVLTVNPESDYDLGRDFSVISNPNGVWSYGYAAGLGAPFNLNTATRTDHSTEGLTLDGWAMSSNSTPTVLHNGTSQTATSIGGLGVFPPGVVYFIPGPSSGESSLGVIRFTVPNGGDGIYQIRAAAGPVYHPLTQQDTDFHVLRNGERLYDVELGRTDTGAYSNILGLVGGDTIDLVIGRGADNWDYYSVLSIEAFIDLLSTNPVPPTIVSQPQSQTVDLGDTVRLGVEVYGSAPVTYQWQFNGTDLPEGTNSTLILKFTEPTNTGDYCVLVTNPYGAARSAVATVTVHSGIASKISSQPTGGQFLTGANVTVSVTALGTAPLSYQWYYNGSLLAGAVSSSLVIEDIQIGQSGTYWVIVTNQFGLATSRGAVVNVWESAAGATVKFANKTNSLIYDVDGQTLLPAGTEYLAQFYAGPDATSLQAVGAAVGFPEPGRFSSGTRVITSVPAGGTATVQVRAWQAAYGTTYEQAFAGGGKTGASPIFTVARVGCLRYPLTSQACSAFRL